MLTPYKLQILFFMFFNFVQLHRSDMLATVIHDISVASDVTSLRDWGVECCMFGYRCYIPTGLGVKQCVTRYRDFFPTGFEYKKYLQAWYIGNPYTHEIPIAPQGRYVISYFFHSSCSSIGAICQQPLHMIYRQPQMLHPYGIGCKIVCYPLPRFLPYGI